MSVYVVSAPSGAGKTTLNRRLIENYSDVMMSISHTTRPPRPGEVNGNHYHFITEDQFKSMADNDEFIEWAKVHGNLYGTSFRELNRILEIEKKPLLEIDVQGWGWANGRLEDAESIFILPPSLKSLWDRLEKRGSDTLQIRWTRLQNAYEEIKQSENYQYFIVNDDLESAYDALKSIVVDGKPNMEESEKGKELCKKLNEEFETADWILELREKLE
ncbi:MAG: guanylate kinase [Pseudobacteriovorax sp.]|nr:guanylate kinase [Pseudobacteriovorax sp.]